MDTAQWPQGIGVVQPGVENTSTAGKPTGEKKPRPQKEQALNCPRCNSTNTKFCYYNNYSLSQPRYFCKTCRRYWTEGGSLRNVPVGGGSRKNKRPSSSSNSTISSNITLDNSSSKKTIPDLTTPPIFSHKISNNHEGHDLNLAYNPYNHGISQFVSLPFDSKILNPQNPNNLSQNSSHLQVMELLKTSGSMIGSRGLGSFMSNININNNNDNSVSHDHTNPNLGHGVYPSSSGFANLHDFNKPGLSFSLDGIENGLMGNNNNINQDHSSRILFPFEDLKPVSTNHDQFEQDDNNDNINRGQGEANGYWNGMFAGGSW